MNTTQDIPRSNGTRPTGTRLWTLAVMACLIAISVCTALEALWPAALLLVALIAMALARAILIKNRTEGGFLAINLVIVIAVLALSGPEKAIGLTLAIAQAVVGAIFLRSLRHPGEDIITRIACAIRPERSAHELAYTRNVCRAWATFMLVMAAISLAFTFFASPHLWWAWKLFGSWALPVGFFCAEWLLRQWILRGEEKNGFRRSWRALRHIDYQRMFEL